MSQNDAPGVDPVEAVPLLASLLSLPAGDEAARPALICVAPALGGAVAPKGFDGTEACGAMGAGPPPNAWMSISAGS